MASVKAIAANDASQRAIARRDAIDCASAACIVVTPKSGSSGSSSCTAARRAGKSDAASPVVCATTAKRSKVCALSIDVSDMYIPGRIGCVSP